MKNVSFDEKLHIVQKVKFCRFRKPHHRIPRAILVHVVANLDGPFRKLFTVVWGDVHR